MTGSTSTLIRYQGPVAATTYTLSLIGQGFSFDGDDVTGGRITGLDLVIGGTTYARIRGLDLSAERFDDLAVPGFTNGQILERFLLGGRDVIAGTGAADRINGYAGSDRLVGGNGTDDLDGGTGNDTLAGGGTFDYLVGGAGNDRLSGGQGNDDLTGNGGKDRFIFDVSVFQNGSDSIADFSRRDDVLVFDNDAYRGIGRAGDLANSKFKNVDTGTLDANDRFFYSQTSGALFYDADGSGFARSAVLIAVFENNIRLTADDFLIVN